jgi:hypothetical protein
MVINPIANEYRSIRLPCDNAIAVATQSSVTLARSAVQGRRGTMTALDERNVDAIEHEIALLRERISALKQLRFEIAGRDDANW